MLYFLALVVVLVLPAALGLVLTFVVTVMRGLLAPLAEREVSNRANACTGLTILLEADPTLVEAPTRLGLF